MIKRNIFIALNMLLLAVVTDAYGDEFPDSSGVILKKWANAYI